MSVQTEINDDEDDYDVRENHRLSLADTSLIEVDRYNGPLFRVTRPNRKQAVNSVLSGEIVYGVKHPLFVLAPLGLALPSAVVALLGQAVGIAVVVASVLLLALSLIWLQISIVLFRRNFFYICGPTVRVNSGFIQPKRHTYYIPDMTEINPVPPKIFFSALNYGSWDPTTPGDEDKVIVTHIKWMKDLAAIMRGIKAQLAARSSDKVVDELKGIRYEQRETNARLGDVMASLVGIADFLRGGSAAQGIDLSVLASSMDRLNETLVHVTSPAATTDTPTETPSSPQ